MGDMAQADLDDQEEADRRYAAAGRHVRALKDYKPGSMTWAKFVKGACGINRRRADELIQLAKREAEREAELDRAWKENRTSERKRKRAASLSETATHIAHHEVAADAADKAQPIERILRGRDRPAPATAQLAAEPTTYPAAEPAPLVRFRLPSSTRESCAAQIVPPPAQMFQDGGIPDFLKRSASEKATRDDP
jgi:hypothetical protein